jgi:type IV secretory pathway VirB4 component
MNIWNLAHKNRITLGSYGYHPFKRSLRLSPFHINSHMHILGITGSGKSKLLAQLALELFRCGRAFTLIDPAGDLARDVLQ